MNREDWVLAGMTRLELIERINLLGDEIQLLKIYKKAWDKLEETEEGWQLRELMTRDCGDSDEVSQ